MKNTFYLIVLFVFFGCASPQTILTNLTKNSHSVAYLYESKKVEQKSAFSIYVDDISIDTLNNPMNAAVYKETGWFLPLLFFNAWKSKNTCVQGNNMIQEDLLLFIKNAFSNEFKRSSALSIDTSSSADFILKIKVNKLQTEGPYVCSGFFYITPFVYGLSYSDKAGPALSVLSISYEVYKNNTCIYSKSKTFQEKTQPIKKLYSNTFLLQQAYGASMVEASSTNLRNGIHTVVQDINTFVTKNN